MFKVGFAFFERLGQRDPALEALKCHAPGSIFGMSTLGMGNAAPGGHPINFPRHDPLRHTQRICMHQGPLIQIGERRQPNMRVWQYVNALAGKNSVGPI